LSVNPSTANGGQVGAGPSREILGDWIPERTQGEHQEHAGDLLGDEPDERP